MVHDDACRGGYDDVVVSDVVDVALVDARYQYCAREIACEEHVAALSEVFYGAGQGSVGEQLLQLFDAVVAGYAGGFGRYMKCGDVTDIAVMKYLAHVVLK